MAEVHKAVYKHDRENSLTLDEMDLKILACKQRNPHATSREIGHELGTSHETVCRHLRRFKNSQFIEQIRTDLSALLPAAVAVYGLTLQEHGSDRLVAARDLMRGMGALVERSEQRHKYEPVTPDDIANAIRNLSSAELADLDRRLAEDRARESGGADADSGVVAGEDASPDPQGSGA